MIVVFHGVITKKEIDVVGNNNNYNSCNIHFYSSDSILI